MHTTDLKFQLKTNLRNTDKLKRLIVPHGALVALYFRLFAHDEGTARDRLGTGLGPAQDQPKTLLGTTRMAQQ